jgi:uncharacterized protein YndB with AHSA1/START domain
VINFDITIDIERPPAEVFDYVVNLEHVPEWNWAIASTQMVTPGPVGIGSRYRQTRSVPGPAVEILEVTGLDPGKRIEIVGDLPAFRARLVYELTPSGMGTRLTNIVELEPLGVLGISASLFPGHLQASIAGNLGILKSVLEGGRSAAT